MAWGLRCRPLQILTLGYLHVFIHELGHALYGKVAGAPAAKITVINSSCEGKSQSPLNTGRMNMPLFSFAGPFAGMAFRVSLLAVCFFSGAALPMVALLVIKASSIAWMTGEMAYMVAGSIGGGGDWREISDAGWVPWTLCTGTYTAAYITGIALAIL